MLLKNKLGKESEVKHLWHGTRDTPSNVISDGQEGFDMRYCSLGGLFGGGNYFAVNASYSTNGYQHNEVNGEKGVFYASVLIGESTTNQVDPQGKNKAPFKPGSNERYDSVYNSNMYVVYSNP